MAIALVFPPGYLSGDFIFSVIPCKEFSLYVSIFVLVENEISKNYLSFAKMFQSSDGSSWKIIPASRLSAIEIWKGNRVLDESHVARISESLHGEIEKVNLNPFRIAVIHEEERIGRYIIDGQHRVSILKQYFTNPDALDFDVVVIEKFCSNESEIIELFKVINTTRSIQWKEDPVLVSNRYIDAFLKEFNKDPKKPVVKSGKTNRPFVSVEKLRDALVSKHVVDWKTTPTEFVDKCREANAAYLETLDTTKLMNKKAFDLKFALGLFDFAWV
jgi:hypothetical protein